MDDKLNRIVIDNGSGSIKAGFSKGEESSIINIDTVIGKVESGYDHLFPNQKYLIGLDALEKRMVLNIEYPIKHGIINNWDDMENIWNYIYKDKLKISPENHGVVLTETIFNTKENREKTLEVFFEKFKVPSLFLGIDSILTLYSNKSSTGVVVDIGKDLTSITPIKDYIPIVNSSTSLNYGGHDITMLLLKLLNERGYSFDYKKDELELRELKEKYLFTVQDYKKCLENQEYLDSIKTEYFIPNKEPIIFDKERFICPELLFNPSIFTNDQSFKSIQMETFNSIINSNSNIEQHQLQKDLFSNILLSGGTSLINNLEIHFSSKLRELLIYNNFKDLNVNVEKPSLSVSALFGGIKLCNSDDFQDKWVSKNEYEEYGSSNIINNKYTF